MAKAKAQAKTIEGPCCSCGAPVVATRAKNDEHRLCCRSVVCDALVHWTEDEWRARATLAARRPPWRVGEPVGVRCSGWCACTGETIPLQAFVIRLDGERATLAPVCPRCRRMPEGRSPWVDDPSVRGGGDPYRWLDFEALRRFSGAEPELWGWRSKLTAEPVVIEPAPVAAPAREEPAAVADPGPVGTLEPVEVASPPPAPLPIAPRPVPAAVVPAASGPLVCMVAECAPKVGFVSRCGRVSKRSKNDCLPDHRMTGWQSKVTCPTCLHGARVASAAA